MVDSEPSGASRTGEVGVRRSYHLNMPQMALGGLSEAWLFRELGDIHWEMISKGLGSPSSNLVDANGDRLYATFTRLRVSSSKPLMAFNENDPVEAQGRISRFGGGVFFGEISLSGPTGSIAAQLMSSFTKRSQSGSNLSLLKGQPLIPPDCSIAAMGEMPDFAQEYRRQRAALPQSVLLQHEYEILPYHDINGVGLLYFAAYPTVNDLSELRVFSDQPSWCLDTSTVTRDVHYYGNCDLHDKVIYRLHSVERRLGFVDLVSSLTRSSDGAPIAYLATSKATGLEGDT